MYLSRSKVIVMSEFSDKGAIFFFKIKYFSRFSEDHFHDNLEHIEILYSSCQCAKKITPLTPMKYHVRVL